MGVILWMQGPAGLSPGFVDGAYTHRAPTLTAGWADSLRTHPDDRALWRTDGAHVASEERRRGLLRASILEVASPIARWLERGREGEVVWVQSDVADLPVELVGLDDQPFELQGHPVVRLRPGRPMEGAWERVRVTLWTPTPEDPVCTTLQASLPIDATVIDRDGLPAAEEGALDIIIVVAHGATSSRWTLQGLRDEDGATVSHTLADRIP
ncbi:MAG: hypothetical protein KC656_25495, partial [Myxococcales bacterium]|nr:hypothetical protein [Myxococcales bacterium]